MQSWQLEMSGADAQPLVSVVIPTYRRPDRLVAAVRTVFAQTLDRWELIIVDDNGPNHPQQRETARRVAEFGGDVRVHYVAHRDNSGAAAARNDGIERARAPFIGFLDDDDRWPRNRLRTMLARFDQVDPHCALVYGVTRYVDEAGNERNRITASHEGKQFSNLIWSNFIGGSGSVLCRTEAVRSVGGFDSRFPAMQDIDLFLRLSEQWPIAAVPSIALESVEHGDGRITNDHRRRAEAWTLRLQKYDRYYRADRRLRARGLDKLGRELSRSGQHSDAALRYREAIAAAGPKPDLLRRYFRERVKQWW